MGTTIDLDAISNGTSYLEFFDTEASLVAKYPTGIDGQCAIIGSTNSIWIWDSVSSSWVDSKISSSNDARLHLSAGIIYLQTKILGVWTNTGTEWEV